MTFLDVPGVKAGELDTKVADAVNGAGPTKTALNATYLARVAAPTGVASTDTAAIEAAVAGLPAAGGQVILSAGTYVINALTITKAVKLAGLGTGLPHGTGGTTLKFSGNGDAVTFTAHGSTVEDLALVHDSWSDGAAAPTAGTGVRVTNGRGTRLHRVTVLGFYDGIRFDAGYYYSISKCQVQDNVRYGLHLLNTATGEGDHGDQIIEGCTLGGLKMSRIPVAAVYWESGGGLRFVGNKTNGSVLPSGVHSSIGTGLEIAVADGVSTSVMVIVGNSIEAWNSAGVDIKQKAGATGTGSIGKIVITGNEIAGNNGTAVAIAPAVKSNFREATIDGNVIGNCSTGISVKNIHTVAIGTNTYTDLTACIVLRQAGVENFRMAPQTAKRATPGELVAYEDTAGDTIEAVVAQSRWEFDREIPDVTSDSVYSTLWKFTVPTFTGAALRVTLSGNLNGVGAFLYDATITLTRATAGVTATVSGTPLTAGGAIDVQYDVASASGSVWVGVKRAAGVGTKIQGMCGASYLGKTSKVIRA